MCSGRDLKSASVIWVPLAPEAPILGVKVSWPFSRRRAPVKSPSSGSPFKIKLLVDHVMSKMWMHTCGSVTGVILIRSFTFHSLAQVFGVLGRIVISDLCYDMIVKLRKFYENQSMRISSYLSI